ncbi:MAG: carboxypeptidase regulatory-like domain-containing protein [Pyrinomonadaceae bacterium]
MKQNFQQKIHFLCLAIALLVSFSGFVAAQEITGTLNGTVRDASGAVVPGATVTISDPTKNDIVVRTLTTNDEGTFSAPNLQSGVYQVMVEAANFKKAVKTNVKVDVGQRRLVDVELEAGNISETVTVEAGAVSVNLNTPTSGTTINGDQVRELAINNRNFVQLVALAPGVSNDLSDQVFTGTTNPEGQPNTVQISVNGARSSQNTFTVDGADITDRGSNITIQAYPSIDSIGEFKVLRSLFPAESGRSGGGQVNVVTRSGTSKFRGSAFEFVRNEKFNANDFLTNSRPGLAAQLGRDDNGKIKRRPFRYNDYGFTFGGPIFFLGIGEGGPTFKRYERTFFFFSAEQRKDRRSTTLVSTLPDANLRRGFFTVPICLQATGTTCNVVLPANSTLPNINPVSQQYLTQVYNKLPLPNGPGIYDLQFPTPAVADFRQEILKIDHSFSDKFSVYYRFQNDKIPTIDANAIFTSGSSIPFVSTTTTNSPGRTHTAQGTYIISPNLIVEGRYTFGYGAILSENTNLLSLRNTSISSPLAYPNTRDRVPSVTGNGFNGLTSFGPYDNFSWKGNITGTLTYIFGNHTTKYGAVYSKYRKNENALAGNNEGLFNGFNIPGTNVATITGFTSVQQNFANFLLGTNATFTQASFDYTADLRQKAFEAFAQDEWKIRRNLTLYYGVRYSFFGSPYDANGRLTNFVPELFNSAAVPQVTGAGNRIPGTGNFCNGLIINSQNTNVSFPNCTPAISPWGKFVVNAPKRNFAPRVGLAFDPFGDGKTSIRTGYGIYHEQTLNGPYLQNIGTNPPYQQTCQVVGTRIDNPVPGGCALVASNTVPNIRALDPNWKTPYMQHWSLDVQRQLTKDTIVTVGYYGSKGTNLIGSFEKNLIEPGLALRSQCATGANTFASPGAGGLVPCQLPNQAFFTTAQSAILDQLRPFPGFRAITVVEPRYNSSYHSMQVSAQHRFSGASQVNLAYTFAKNLTDNQNDRSASPQNTYDISKDKARAALDRRHILSIDYIYELPFFSEQKGFVGKLLGGWQVSGIATYNTGLPFTATVSGFDPAGLGLIPPPTTVARANVLCNPNEGGAGTATQYFNTSCFQATPLSNATAFTNTVGNGGRGIIEGPPTKRLDFTLAKNLRFSERFKLQLRAEAFNVFNTTNFRGLSTGVFNTSSQPVSQGGNGTSTFGQVISVRDPRVIQFGIKMNF